MTEFGQYRIQALAFVICVGAAFVFSCLFVSNLIGLESPETRDDIRLDNRINPNTASAASMARLPGIGPAKAEAIVVYRRHFRGSDSGKQPFETTDDLQNVNGIGPKTAQNISQWLTFE